MSAYLPDGVEIWTHPMDKGKDFEDLKELNDLLTEILRADHRLGISYHDMVIDVTGGQKTASIAATLVTLTGRVKIQYVQTGAANDVVFYDMVAESPPEL